MMNPKRLVFVLLLVGLTLICLGCPAGVTIADIQKDPGRYYNKEVAIRGTVTSSFGAFGSGMFQLEDHTGRIWVMTQNQGVPSQGARVGVVGQVLPTVTFGGRSFATVLRETKRRD